MSINSLVTLDAETSIVKVGDKSWDVPKNVNVAAADVEAGQCKLYHIFLAAVFVTFLTLIIANHNTWKSGQEAIKSLSADMSLSGKYMAFKCDASASYAMNKSFNTESSYDLFSYVKTHAIVKLTHLAKSMDETEILKIVQDYKPWNEKDKATRDDYRSFYELNGSHIIIGCDYGAKFSMVCLRHELVSNDY